MRRNGQRELALISQASPAFGNCFNEAVWRTEKKRATPGVLKPVPNARVLMETAPAWGRVGPPNRISDGGGRKFQSGALALDTAKRRNPSWLPTNRSGLIRQGRCPSSTNIQIQRLFVRNRTDSHSPAQLL
jgi:hypothetical protein